MSTYVKPTPRRKGAPQNGDPFEYGWRYVRKNGAKKMHRVPLTLWDILHPQVGDFRVLSDAHNEDCAYLKSVFKVCRPRATILADHRIVWGVPGLEAHGPDVMAILKAKRRRGIRPPTFNVAEEGARPELLVEVTSPATRQTDLRDKVDEYFRAGVLYYIIVDELPSKSGKRRLRLLGYERGQNGFVPMTPNERGRLWLEPIGVWLGIKGERIACYDKNGKEIGDYEAVAAALKAAEEKAAEEAKARTVAEAKADEDAKARLAAEAKAAQEASARTAAEERIRELESEIQRLRDNGRT